MQSDTITFSAAVRAVGHEARRLGLSVPAFRSPPGIVGVDRTIRRLDGAPIVAVRVHGRSAADVAADIIDGVFVANGMGCADDMATRHRLIEAVCGSIRSVA